MNRAPALTEGLGILELVAHSSDPVPFETIVSNASMSRSSCARLVKVLLNCGHIAQPGSGQGYVPGIRLFSIAHSCQGRSSALQQMNMLMRSAAEDTGTSVQYAILDRSRGRVVVVARQECEDSLHTAGPGTDITSYAHRHALCKAILAFCDPAVMSSVMDQCRPVRKTENTIMPGSGFDACLENVRKRKYAEDREESSAHVFRVAVPVFDLDDNISAAVCSAWFAAEFDKSRAAALLEILEEIRSAATLLFFRKEDHE